MTAEEYLTQNTLESNDLYFRTKVVDIWTAKEYARLKCKELLEIVAERVKAEVLYEWSANTVNEYAVVDKDSILNAVDLDSFCS